MSERKRLLTAWCCGVSCVLAAWTVGEGAWLAAAVFGGLAALNGWLALGGGA